MNRPSSCRKCPQTSVFRLKISGTMWTWLNVCVISSLSAVLARVSCVVSPPVDLRVQCRNFQNILIWNYSDPMEQTEFTVTIRSYLSGVQPPLKTKQNYLDITSYTQNFSDVYYTSVEAQLNGSEHSSTSKISFTYSPDGMNTKCAVDFPNISVSVLKHTIKVSFDDPYDVYGIEELNDDFIYTVKCNETECGEYDCSEQCTAEIPIPENLYGQCFDLYFNGANSIHFEYSKEVCDDPEEPKKADVAFLTGLACAAFVLLLLLIVVGVEIYKKVTGSDSQRAIISKLLGIVNSDPSVIEPERPELSEVKSLGHTPLLVTPNCDISTPDVSEEFTQLPINFMTNVESPEDEEQNGSEEDEDFTDICNEGYDCKKFPLEMSPGDVVEAYRP